MGPTVRPCAESDELLSRLANEALADHRAGATTPLDPADL